MTLALLLSFGRLMACDPKPGDSAGPPTSGADVDGDGFDALEAGGDDCDDGDAAINPWATELCNAVDDDCDGTIDEAASADAPRWYPDGDADGYGRSDDGQTSCVAPAGSGWAQEGGDCDDTDPRYHPDALEDDCTDPADYDCDGRTRYADVDADGQPACEDCDDEDPSVHAGATEVCDALDNDCDGFVDDEDGGVVADRAWFPDGDGDGYGVGPESVLACEDPGGYADNALDCDDGEPLRNPGAAEVCDALDLDEDCDGAADDLDPDVSIGGTDAWYPDVDADGFGGVGGTPVMSCDRPTDGEPYAATDDDCDDADPAVNPAADEVCDPADADEDCDGLADDLDADTTSASKSAWYSDADEDGYGAGGVTLACQDPSTAGSAYAEVATDCDDADPAVSPAGQEVCDAADRDEDCDGRVDDDDVSVSAASKATWYEDTDGDGYGGAGSTRAACADPGASWYAAPDDCDDDDGGVHPGAVERCDDADDDCDPATYGSGVVWTSAAGADTDVSATFAAGRPGVPVTWTSTANGALSFCDGTWYTRLILNHDVDVLGWGPVELDGEGLGPVVVVTGAGVDVSLTDLVLNDGAGYLAGSGASHNGGSGVRCHDAGSLTLDGVTLTAGSSTYAGGMYLESCDTVAYDTVFHANDASYYGGGVYVLDSELTMEACEITDNIYPYNGGAIFADDYSDITLVDCLVSGNHATRTGGAFFLDNATLTLIGGSVIDNYATDEGGGAYLSLSSYANLVSDGTDWGSGALDNVPDDISVFDRSGYFVGPDGDIACTQSSCE